MQQTSPEINSISALAKRVQELKESDQAQAEQLIRIELQKLAQSLIDASQTVLSTTLNDMRSQSSTQVSTLLSQLAQLSSTLQGSLSALQGQVETDLTKPLAEQLNDLKEPIRSLSRAISRVNAQTNAVLQPKAWIKPLVVGLSLFIGISAGSWGLMQYLSSRVQSQLQTLHQQQATLDQLQSQTWGLSLRDTGTDRYLVLPPGYKLEPGWTISERPALKLSKQ